MNRVILDTSIIIKWYLKDEEYENKALDIFEDLKNEKILLAAPYILSFEFNNVLNIASKRNRISKKDLFLAIKTFINLPIIYYDLNKNSLEILKNAINLDISSYDSAYLILSEELNIPFYTADEKLINKNLTFNIKHIKNYL